MASIDTGGSGAVQSTFQQNFTSAEFGGGHEVNAAGTLLGGV